MIHLTRLASPLGRGGYNIIHIISSEIPLALKNSLCICWPISWPTSSCILKYNTLYLLQSTIGQAYYMAIPSEKVFINVYFSQICMVTCIWHQKMQESSYFHLTLLQTKGKAQTAAVLVPSKCPWSSNKPYDSFQSFH